MVPGTLSGLLVFVVAVAPGYVFLRITERRALRPPRSALLETADLIGVGLLSSAVATLVTLALGELAPLGFLELRRWAVEGALYLRAHPWQALSSAAVALLLSLGLSAAVGFLSLRGQTGRVQPGSVWHAMFRRALPAPNAPPRTATGYPPFLVVELKDGRRFEGFVGAFGTDDPGQPRELALQAPLYVRNPGHRERIKLAGRFVVIPGDQITLIHGTYVQPHRDAPAT